MSSRVFLAVLLAGAAYLAQRYYFHDATVYVDTLDAEYDYIIVGAGAAGSVLAGRLSEDENVTVLLLEAGPTDQGDQQVHTPALAVTLMQETARNWGYLTQPQDGLFRGLDKSVGFWPRGKGLGGSGNINGMQWVRGNRHDYDRWAVYTGNERWDYRHVLPYFKQMEDMRIGALRDSRYHGQTGPMTINHFTSSAPIAQKHLDAARELGYPDNNDYNGNSMEGMFHSQVNVKNSARWSSSRAYIHSAVPRPNLHISINSHVLKVLFEGKNAVGVDVLKGNVKTRVKARKEVILSAGSIGSSQILLLSGVGPKADLEKLHIPVVADLPVGQNLQDHVMFQMRVRVNESVSWSFSELTSLVSLISYYLLGSGRLTSSYALENLAFLNKAPESKAKDWPELQLHILNELLPVELNYIIFSKEVADDMDKDNIEYGYMCNPSLLRPESRGTIKLLTTDPFDHPNITANYLQSEQDINTLIQGIDECIKLLNTKTMQALGAELLDKKPMSECKKYKYGTREHWACELRNRPMTIYHPVGTCKMGKVGDKTAVVGPDLKVQGLKKLRVVDASVMPYITSGNTYAPTVLIGEVAADLIRQRKPLDPVEL